MDTHFERYEQEEQQPAPDTYWHRSASSFMSVTFLIPLIVLYEVGTIIVDTATSTPGMRNAADVWTKKIFSLFGLADDAVVLAVVIAVVWLATFVEQKSRTQEWPRVRLRTLGLMVLESCVYGMLLGTVVSWMTARFLTLPFAASFSASAGTGLFTNLVLSLGAGIYEELVFRFFLLGALSMAFRQLFGKELGVVLAIGLASFVFSAFHYIGPFGDPVELTSFLFRFFGGVVLSVMYLTRGIGITAYAHAIYDVQFYLLQ